MTTEMQVDRHTSSRRRAKKNVLTIAVRPRAWLPTGWKLGWTPEAVDCPVLPSYTLDMRRRSLEC